MATTRTASFHAWPRSSSQATTLTFVRPEACPSRPCGPARSTKLVSKVSKLRPVAGLGVAGPTGPAATGLINAEDLHRLGIGQPGDDGGDERGVRGRPAQQPRTGDADRQPRTDPVGHVPAQPP